MQEEEGQTEEDLEYVVIYEHFLESIDVSNETAITPWEGPVSRAPLGTKARYKAAMAVYAAGHRAGLSQ